MRRIAAPGRGKVAAARRMTKAEVAQFVAALGQASPEGQTELAFADAYRLVVGVGRGAQATYGAFNTATVGLFADAPDPAAMVRLGEEGVARHIRAIGLWRGKAHNVVALSAALLARHGGAVPADREALEALPGVGRKTASVVLNVAFGADAMAVDTHILRLGNRTGLAPGATPRAVEDGLVAGIPPAMLRPAHHWLILHGRYVCKARAPECWHCVGRSWCQYPDKRDAPAG